MTDLPQPQRPMSPEEATELLESGIFFFLESGNAGARQFAGRARAALLALRKEQVRVGTVEDDLKAARAMLGNERVRVQEASDRIDSLTRDLAEARANYAFMVERACNEKLDGYRELGAKCAELERERDEARKQLREAHDTHTREVYNLLNVVCDHPACTAAIIRLDSGARVCSRGHGARWVNVELLTKKEAEIDALQARVKELEAESVDKPEGAAPEGSQSEKTEPPGHVGSVWDDAP